MLLVFALTGLMTAAPAASDPGARAFQRCAACHDLSGDADGLSGPALDGVYGRAAGGDADFRYSDAMRRAGRQGLIWNRETLARFLADPETVVPGTSMPFQGGSEAERRAVIDWLSRNARP